MSEYNACPHTCLQTRLITQRTLDLLQRPLLVANDCFVEEEEVIVVFFFVVPVRE